VWLGGISSCVVAVAGLRLGMRTSDASLLALDRAIGVDGARVLTWTRHQPDWFVHLLATSYAATVPFAFLSLILLSLVGDRIEVWRAVLCFVGTVLTTCLIAAIVPALGMSAWISPELLDRLSTGAPRHFWPRFQHFHRFHDGTAVVLGLGSMARASHFRLSIQLWDSSWPPCGGSEFWSLCRRLFGCCSCCFRPCHSAAIISLT